MRKYIYKTYCTAHICIGITGNGYTKNALEKLFIPQLAFGLVCLLNSETRPNHAGKEAQKQKPCRLSSLPMFSKPSITDTEMYGGSRGKSTGEKL